MNTYNNEAGRLFDLFEKAFAVEGNDLAWTVWATLFNIRLTGPRLDDNLPPICKQLILISEVLDSVETDIREQIPAERSELLLRPFPDLRLCCIPSNLEKQWGECRKRLSQHSLDVLKMCAQDLPKETEIPEGELVEIARQIEELIATVRDSRLDRNLKKWMLEQLFILRRGIEQVWLNGGRGLKAALARVLGDIRLDEKTFEEIKTGDPGIFTMFVSLVEGTFGFASKTNIVYTFLEHAHTTLPVLVDFSAKLLR